MKKENADAGKERCAWSCHPSMKPLYVAYHDHEWGVAVHDDRLLFEFLILEGVQAGLNWAIVLDKRENYRRAYNDFMPEVVARYDSQKVMALLQDRGIIRNKLKVVSSITNARAFLAVQKAFGSFDTYIWSFVNGEPIQHRFVYPEQIPTRTDVSDAMSIDLKKRGFKFVGTTICYAYMQAVGMVNDHTMNCFRYRELGGNLV